MSEGSKLDTAGAEKKDFAVKTNPTKSFSFQLKSIFHIHEICRVKKGRERKKEKPKTNSRFCSHQPKTPLLLTKLFIRK
jgi:hypothetical protein